MSESREQNRIQPVGTDHATGAIGRLIAEMRAKFALMPNLFRVLANAPVALEGLMHLSAALARRTLSGKTHFPAHCLAAHRIHECRCGP